MCFGSQAGVGRWAQPVGDVAAAPCLDLLEGLEPAVSRMLGLQTAHCGEQPLGLISPVHHEIRQVDGI